MKRKMIGAAAAYMSGLFFASFFTEGSDLLLLAGLLPVFFIIMKLLKYPMKDFVIIAAFFTAACTAGKLYTYFVYDKIVKYADTEGSFSGEVEDAEYYSGDSAMYTLDGKINGTQSAKIIFFSDAYDVSVGDVVTLDSSAFSIPDHDFLFDSETYYKSNGIFLTAGNAEISNIDHFDSFNFMQILKDYREQIILDFKMKIGETEGGFLSGIVFGEKSGIDANEKTLMYRCGIGHIMAVSGIHVSIMAAFLMLILKRLRVGKYISFAILNVFMAFIILMAESPVSGIRAAIMLDFMYSARLFRRQKDTFNSLSAAVLMICLVNPYVIYNSGFLLSVAGTFGIGVFAPYMTENMKSDKLYQRFLKDVTGMFCTALAIMPVSMIFFDEISIISPLTNVLIIPLTVIAMLIGMIYVLTGGIISMLSAAEFIIDAVLVVTNDLGHIDLTYFSVGNRNLIYVASICSVLVILTAVILRKRRYISIVIAGALVSMVFSSSIMGIIEKDKFKLAVLGKGNNAVVVISYHGRTDVIDLSGNYKNSRYVKKYLSINGISNVRILMLTRKYPSQYAAYCEDSLELVNIENIVVPENLYLSDENDAVKSFSEGSLEIKSDSYCVYCEEDFLKVDFGKASAVFMPVRSEIESDADITVYYGNITENTEICADGRSIYLDETDDIFYPYSGMNNFEITASKGGEFSIRRL